VTAYQAEFDTDGDPAGLDGEDGLAARLVPMAEVAANGHDLNIGRYLRQTAAEAEDLGTLIDAYNLARAERQKTEARMLEVLAEAGIEGFDE
jgi:type I restriction enzyme M protein